MTKIYLQYHQSDSLEEMNALLGDLKQLSLLVASKLMEFVS